MTDKYKEALESMVWQFGFRGVRNGKPILHTGGLSVLEEAFEALGYSDPYYVVEDDMITCNIKGCHNWSDVGTHWGNGKEYIRLAGIELAFNAPINHHFRLLIFSGWAPKPYNLPICLPKHSLEQ